MTVTSDPGFQGAAPLPRLPWRSYLLAIVALLGSLLLVLLYWRSAEQRARQAAEAAFGDQAEAMETALQQRLHTYELIARGGVSLFATVERPTAAQWRDYVQALDIPNRYADMMGLGYAPALGQSGLQQLQLAQREAGQGMYSVRPAGVRELYGPILYLEPLTAANREAIGYDGFSDPTRRAAMQAARDQAETSMTDRVLLVQDAANPTPGLLMYTPVYHGATPATLAGRRQAFRGWVYVPLQASAFVDGALAGLPHDIDLRITDIDGDFTTSIYDDPSFTTTATSEQAFKRSLTLELYGRHWRLDFATDGRARTIASAPQLRATLATGVLASLLLFGIALALARTESLAEQKAARLSEAYRRSELRFRNAMRFSAIGNALLDRGGTVVDANPALAGIFATSLDALVGSMFDRWFAGQQDENVRQRELQAISERVYRCTRRLQRSDGEERQLQLTFAPVPGEAGQDVASLVQVEDITERMQAREQEIALNRRLELRVAERTRELTQANHELEAFAYSVSHDLRAPLRSIEGFSRLLAERHDGAGDDTGRDYLARIRNAAGRMDKLIDALLTMSRVSRGTLAPVELDIGTMAQEVADGLQAAEPGRQVEVLIESDLHAVGDVSLVRNLLQNLIGNAWKFSAGCDRARIVIGRTDPDMHDSMDDGMVHLYVRDNGVGFDQQYVDKLFRPFQRLHGHDEFDGNGIGLASVKRIVERHGGSISAQGVVGEGAIFRFTLPKEMPREA